MPQAQDWFSQYEVTPPKPPTVQGGQHMSNAPGTKPAKGSASLAARVRAKYPGAYDDLDDATLEAKILAKHPEYRDLAQSPAGPTARGSAAPDPWFDKYETAQPAQQPAQPSQPEGSALGRFASNAWQMVNPIEAAKGLVTAIANPVETISKLYDAQVGQETKAKKAWAEGRYSEAIGHGVAAHVPIIGPVAANIGEQIGHGDIAGGLGQATGLIGGIVAPGVIGRKLPQSIQTRPVVRNSNPVDAAAVTAGQKAGVPIDVATATGSRFAAGVKNISDRTLGGSGVAAKASQAQTKGLASMGEQLAAKGHALPVTAESAGEAISSAVRNRIVQHADEADTAYEALRKIEADPKHSTTVTVTQQGRVAGGGTIPIKTTQQVPLAVDLSKVKAQLKPTYDRMLRESELVPLQGDKGRALTALDRLMNAPDHAPLSIVDSALGDLKSLARADVPELRTAGQGAAAGAVKFLDAQVRAAAAKAGPEAVQALEAGRRATVNKYAAADVLDSLRTEPVQTFRAMTAPKDSGIARLRDVAKHAPDELPKLGRAYLDDLLDTATSEGGFTNAATIANKWKNLGPETKTLLFKDPAHVKELDNFFHLMKIVNRNVNPSGTAATATAAGQGVGIVTALGTMEPLSAVALIAGPYAVAKFLHSPVGVKLLTRGLKIPAGNKAARTAYLGQLSSYANQLKASTAANQQDREWGSRVPVSGSRHNEVSAGR